MTSCTNHTCEHTINIAQDTHVLCPLCRNAAYCSEECRMIDWAAHACPNAVRVDKVGTLLATPYFYEDEMPADIIGEELLNEASPLKESFLLHHVGTDMKVTQWIQVGEMAVPYAAEVNPKISMGRGSNPEKLFENMPTLVNREFEIIVQSESNNSTARTTFAGKVGIDAIYAGNKENSKASAIAKSFISNLLSKKQTESILLWPNPKLKAGRDQFPRAGYISVELKIAGMEPLSVEFEHVALSNKSGRLTSLLTKRLEARLKLKFPGTESGIKYMQTLRAKTPSGLIVNLTFSVKPNQTESMQLKDVEFLVPDSEIRPESLTKSNEEADAVVAAFRNVKSVSSESIYCDATNISHMTGLTMALEYAQAQIKAGIAEGNAQNNIAFENAAAIVRKHTRAMLDGKSFVKSGVPMEVNAAVYTAVNALHEMQTIEISISKDRVKLFSDKLLRAGGKVNAEALAVQSLTPIVEELERIRSAAASSPRKGAKGWVMKKVDTVKKSRLDKQLDEWKIAIENYLNAQEPGTRFAQADALIRRGKNPTAVPTPQ